MHPNGGPRARLAAVALTLMLLVAAVAAVGATHGSSAVAAVPDTTITVPSPGPAPAAPVADGAADSAGRKPSRGTAQQVTPTLPPPTTTTTEPPVNVIPPNSGEGRRVIYSNSRQRVWAVDERGKLVKTHPVSGKRWVPPAGTYSVFSRSLYTASKKNPNIRWMYMVRFTTGPEGDNIGFHEIPTQCDSAGRCWKLQSESQLGQPLSGGCVRQATADAIWMWNFAQIGTKVVVLP